MPVFKDEKRGTWYVMAWYRDWTGERKQSLMDPRCGAILMKQGKEYRDKLNTIVTAKLEAIKAEKGCVTQEDKDKAREEAIRSDSLKAVKKGYLKTKSEEAVRKKVEEIAEELYNRPLAKIRISDKIEV